MSFYQNLKLPLKVTLALLASLITAVAVIFLQHDYDNAFLQFLTALLIFLNLYLVFNLSDFKIYTRIFLGLGLGLITGMLAGEVIQVFYPVGKVFIRLIKMIVVPLVFASLLVGTASLNDIRKLGRIGIKTILFYLISTAIAISIGLAVANIINPGDSLPASITQELNQNYEKSVQEQISTIADRPSTIDLFLEIIPENPARAMADAKMLQIIFFAIMSGIALTYIQQERRTFVVRFFEGVTDITIAMVHLIMKLAPYGVFALIAYVISQYGSEIILTLLSYFMTTIAALVFHVIIFNSIVIVFFTDLGVRQFWSGIYPALLVAFSTSSSSATLPVTIDSAESNLAVKPEIASFVLPLGSTINMDGTAIFQGVSAVFIANVYGMDLTLIDQLTIILTATLASIGTAGAPQVGIIMLTLVLQSIGIPVEGIALIMGVERFLDMSRTMVNVTSDLSCSAFINKNEG
jgi:Na+/H+-dicarboxylate symporter